MRIAIIPIKHISERLPGKNFKIVNGLPLYSWIIQTLHSCVDKILIETDSPVIQKECGDGYSEKVHVIMRPENICGHTVSTNALINHILTLSDMEITQIGIKRSDFDTATFIQTHVTNPCLTAQTIMDALNQYESLSVNQTGSMFCVTKKQSRYYDHMFVPINHDLNDLLPTQQLPLLYEDNSCFYIFTKNSFMQYNNRISSNAIPYVIKNKWEAIDIDYEDDLELAEYWLMKVYPPLKPKKTVLITGSAGGLGSELCKYFNEKGWTVIGTDLIDGVPCDLSSPDQIKQLCAKLKENVLDFEGVVLCAAYQECHTLCDTPLESWNKTFDINLRANYLLIKELLQNGQLRSGTHITIIGSVHSWVTSPGIAAYSITKSALVNMTRVLAMELGAYNIIVNCLHPGAILTPMLLDGLARDYNTGNANSTNSSSTSSTSSTSINKQDYVAMKLEKMAAKHPLGRVALPNDIAKAVFFLTSSENTAFHGSNLIADGGVHVRLATE